MIKKILLSLLILVAATSAAHAAEESFSDRKAHLAEVSAVRIGYGSGTIRIVVDMTKKVNFVESYAENPSRMILDLQNSWLSPTVKREIELKSLAAKKIRVAQFDPSTVRIVIETMADTKSFHLEGGPKGHRFVIDVGNSEFKPNPEINQPQSDVSDLKEQQERELRERQERERLDRELKERQERERLDRELKEQQERERLDRELKERQERERLDRELKERQERELKERQERERLDRELKEQQERERQDRELKEQQERERQERELKERQERELKERQERELKERQERELKEQQERERQERELKERQERELKERQERELKERQERELKERQERELKERQERERQEQKERERRERELKEQQERELKEQRERERQEQKERERQERELKKQQERELKEQRERERREQKERERQEKRDKKNKDKDDQNKEVNEPFIELDNDLDKITALRGKTIVIDPGHGGNDAGAIGPTGVMEKTVTLKVSLELKKLLEAEGATVIMTRETDTTVSSKGAKASDIEELGARCEVANRAGADIFISIHADSFTRPEARGTTGYYYSKSTTGKGQKLADCIRRNLVEQLGTPSRGTQPCNFYVVKNTDMPATLIELGFISNKEEEQLLNSKEGVQKAAQGILDGIEDYFG